MSLTVVPVALASAFTLARGISQLPEIAACVHAQGARLYALSPRRISLEQLFLNVVGSQDSGQ